MFKPRFSILRLRGPDTKSFLHRISTNSVTDQKTGDTCINVLVDAKGRMVEYFHQLILSDNEILLIASGDRAAELMTWFDQFLFTEDLEIIDITQTSTLWWHPGLPQTYHNYFVIPSRKSYFLFSPTIRDDIKSTIDADTYECLRIAACTPAYPNEINSAYNPLEIGLRDAIHWAKGCYIGQEVISRMDTYQKQRKQLVPIICSEEEFSHLQIGNGITSIAPKHTAHQPVALAVVKSSIDSLPVQS